MHAVNATGLDKDTTSWRSRVLKGQGEGGGGDSDDFGDLITGSFFDGDMGQWQKVSNA